MDKTKKFLLMFGNGISIPVSDFDADYQAILDRADVLSYVKPSPEQQIIQNQLMIDSKSNGIYAEEDIMYVPANDGSFEFGCLNWKDPSNYELTIGTSAYCTIHDWRVQPPKYKALTGFRP